MNKSFSQAIGAALGTALVFSVSISAFGAEEPPIMPRGLTGWGAQPAKVKRDPPILAPVEKIETKVSPKKEGGKSVIEIEHWGTNQKNVENKMLLRSEPAKYLTVHHTQVKVQHGDVKKEMWQHQNSMFRYFTEGAVTDKSVTVNGEPVIVRHRSFRLIYLGDTPYHFRIDATGQILEGRELEFSAYSNTEYRTPISEHVTVVLEGDFTKPEKARDPEGDRPTPEQIRSLVKLLHHLAVKHEIALANIDYHKNVGNSKCPGEYMIAEFDKQGGVRDQLRTLGIK